jgi:ATP-dependent Lon protease
MDSQFTPQIDKLKQRIADTQVPEALRLKLSDSLDQLKLLTKNEKDFWSAYQKLDKYLDWTLGLPWNTESQDQLDLNQAREILDQGHFGLDQVKERILEYVSVLGLQKQRNPTVPIRAPILLFSGLVGTGKTTMAKSIANVLGRKIIRIPFGGLGDPLYLRGQSRLHPEAEPGQIIKGLHLQKVRNPVILLDEIDRVADDALNTIMGVLVELLDPEQNDRFTDHYIDYPFDLSQALFVATCNNTNRIATAVMDRLEPIQMPSYTDSEKTAIGKDYLLPQALKDTGLKPQELQIQEATWPQIIRPLGFDSGVRTLKRTIESLCHKAAKLIFEQQAQSLTISPENVKEFIPRW